MEQATAFLEESRQLLNLMSKRPESDYYRKTQFKSWDINQVLGHLHIFNHAADLSLRSSTQFEEFFSPIRKALLNGKKLVDTQEEWLDGLSGTRLLDAWWGEVEKVSSNFSSADPKLRLKWAGPEMSARSSITARQMETWAHGQEVFDILGKTRLEHDRIKNIVHL